VRPFFNVTHARTHARTHTHTYARTHTHTRLTALCPGLPGWAGTRKGKLIWILLKLEWQWHQLGRKHVCTLLQTDNHASTPPLSFLQAGCPSYCPTNSIIALKVCILQRQRAQDPFFGPVSSRDPTDWGAYAATQATLDKWVDRRMDSYAQNVSPIVQ